MPICQLILTAANTLRNKGKREGIVITLKVTYLSAGIPCGLAATWPFLCSAVAEDICYKIWQNICNTTVIFKTAQYLLEEASL